MWQCVLIKVLPEQGFLDDDEDRSDLEGVVVRVEGIAEPTTGQSVCVNSVVEL